MKCLREGSVLAAFIIVYASVNIVCSAPSVSSSGEGGGGGYTPYDDDDRVTSRVIDHQANSTDFQIGGNDNLRRDNNDVISTVLDLNNISAAGLLLKKFNITTDDILRRKAERQPQPPATNYQSNVDNDDTPRSDAEQIKLHIKEKIQSVVVHGGSTQNAEHKTVEEIDASDVTTNEISFYPVCSKNNETSWSGEHTAKLYFSSTVLNKLAPNVYLNSSLLRLHFVDNGDMTKPRCGESDKLIRITISVIVKRNNKGGNNRSHNSSRRAINSRREIKYKKRICNSFTTAARSNDWLEIDIKQVIRHWQEAHFSNNSNRGVIPEPMLAIDVEDQDQNPLRASDYFVPTDCQASATPIPWSLLQGVGDKRDNNNDIQVPRFPRLDIIYSRPSQTNAASVGYPHHRSHHHSRKNYNRVNNVNYHRVVRNNNNSNNNQPEDHQNYRYITDVDYRKRHLHNRREHHRHHNVATTTV